MEVNRTGRLAEFMAQIRLERLPHEVVHLMKLCILDHFGCALGAVNTEAGRVHLRVAENSRSEGPCTLIGSGQKIDPSTAALTNAVLSHVFIFDDLHRQAKLHPGVTVVPAVLAVSELSGTDGKTFLEASVAGYETVARVGMAVGMAEHRLKGWRATGTCGSFGAAAGAARALNQDGESLHHALAVAAAQASGNFAFTEGAGMELYLAAGTAARNGVVSALLAGEGFRGSSNPVEAPDGGFFSTTTDRANPELLTQDLGERFWLMETSIKLYPTCHSSQTGIDAALNAAEKHGIRLEDVERMKIRAGEITKIQCGWDYEVGPPAKMIFHMGYAMAVALKRGKVLPGDFEGEALRDPELVRLARATEVVVDPEFTAIYHKKKPCDVTFFLKSGTEVHERVDYCRGDPENRPSKDAVIRKFRDLTAPFLSVSNADAIIDFILNLEDHPSLSPLSELLRPRENQPIGN